MSQVRIHRPVDCMFESGGWEKADAVVEDMDPKDSYLQAVDWVIGSGHHGHHQSTEEAVEGL